MDWQYVCVCVLFFFASDNVMLIIVAITISDVTINVAWWCPTFTFTQNVDFGTDILKCSTPF